uniref:Complex 1 LYR protein domain-containing protein n=1 Tax=Mandrillus leucophaeus TaxID=9568 RepID=A0A2K5ZHL3_MANLE
MSRHSRLQRQVLSLYRDLLRAGRGKPGAENRLSPGVRGHPGQHSETPSLSGHATAMGAFVRPRAPTEEPGGVGSQPDDGDGPRSPHDSTGAPETRPDGR